jgi:hypothetical protein
MAHYRVIWTESIVRASCLVGVHGGRQYVMAVYEEVDEVTVLPVTAYGVPEPRQRPSEVPPWGDRCRGACPLHVCRL